MALSSSTSYREHTVSSTAVATYAYNYRIIDSTDMHVYYKPSSGSATVSEMTYSTHFSVTDAGQDTGGNVVISAAGTALLTVGSVLRLQREVDYTQETDYVENDTFPAQTHEDALDKVTMQCQQLNRNNSKYLWIDDEFSTATIVKVQRTADRYLRWNASGSGIDAAYLITNSLNSYWENLTDTTSSNASVQAELGYLITTAAATIASAWTFTGKATFGTAVVTQASCTKVVATTGSFTTAKGTTCTFTTVKGTNFTIATLAATSGTFSDTLTVQGTFTCTTGAFTQIVGSTVSATTVKGTTASFTTYTNYPTSSTFATGTVATPSLRHTGDQNTGLNFPAADNLQLCTSGTAALLIGSNGNITEAKKSFVQGYKSAIQNINDSSATLLTWTEVTDRLNEFASTVFTAASGGVYLITVQVNWQAWAAADKDSYYQVAIRHNGTEICNHAFSATSTHTLYPCNSAQICRAIATGGTVAFKVYHNTGAQRATNNGNGDTTFSIMKVA